MSNEMTPPSGNQRRHRRPHFPGAAGVLAVSLATVMLSMSTPALAQMRPLNECTEMLRNFKAEIVEFSLEVRRARSHQRISALPQSTKNFSEAMPREEVVENRQEMRKEGLAKLAEMIAAYQVAHEDGLRGRDDDCVQKIEEFKSGRPRQE